VDGFDLDAHTADIDRDGFTVARDSLSPEDLTEVRRVLAFYLGSHKGRNFEDRMRISLGKMLLLSLAHRP